MRLRNLTSLSENSEKSFADIELPLQDVKLFPGKTTERKSKQLFHKNQLLCSIPGARAFHGRSFELEEVDSGGYFGEPAYAFLAPLDHLICKNLHRSPEHIEHFHADITHFRKIKCYHGATIERVGIILIHLERGWNIELRKGVEWDDPSWLVCYETVIGKTSQIPRACSHMVDGINAVPFGAWNQGEHNPL